MPGLDLGEKEMLVAWLEFHRATLAWKCEGLTDEQLRERSVPPSTLSLIGLLRHMADVERGWFRITFAGEDIDYVFDYSEDDDAEFNDTATATHAEALAQWEAECDKAREIVAGAEMNDMAAKERRGEPVSMRWIMTHMIEEYARHNGHADLLRESIDGATGDY